MKELWQLAIYVIILYHSYKRKREIIRYYNFIEVSGWNPEIAQTRFEKSKFYYNEFIKKNLTASMVPHAPYSVSGNLWGKITPFFSGKVVTIHNQETKYEDQFFLEGSPEFEKMYKMMNIDNSFYMPQKLRSIETYFKNLSAASSVILVHNTFTTQEDVDYINRNKPLHPVGFILPLCQCKSLYRKHTATRRNAFYKINATS